MSEDSEKPAMPKVSDGLPEAVKEELPGGPRQARLALFESMETKELIYNSPLPPPQILEHYENIQPGSMNTIIEMARAQQAHRMECEKFDLETSREAMRATVGHDKRSQWQSFALMVILFGFSAWLFSQGMSAGGIGVILGALGTIILTLWWRKQHSNAGTPVSAEGPSEPISTDSLT